MKASVPPRFGFERLLELLEHYHAEAGTSSGQECRAALDRRAVLARLERDLGAGEALLLRRGFDKAYRRMVEGV